ncbi:mycothiol transferase [Micromonospora sp. H33]|uniref:mycothiol transferase n=1 Tax=Micromonospora sp. H33 TaxID=3452215 RepID=UPI003F886CDF
MSLTMYVADEREMLLAFLQRQRDQVVCGVADLPEEARRVATASGLTVPRLVGHLRDVERCWLRRWFAGEKDLPAFGLDTDHVGGPPTPDRMPLPELVEAYVAESRRCDEVVAAHGLDDVAANGRHTLRWILHHLVAETARHLGHLDLLREAAADGSMPGAVDRRAADAATHGAAAAGAGADPAAGGSSGGEAPPVAASAPA